MYWAVWEEWGTNYRRYAEAETREGIDQKILTRSVYPAKKHTIQIFVKSEETTNETITSTNHC